jgi:hypothetical protein
VCPVCRALHGYTWVFKIKKDTRIPDVLTHPVYGAVWSLKGSLIKEEYEKCRCELNRELDLSDILNKTQILRDNLETKYGLAKRDRDRKLTAAKYEALLKKVLEDDRTRYNLDE